VPTATSTSTLSWNDGVFERAMQLVGFTTYYVVYNAEEQELFVWYSDDFFDGALCSFNYLGSHMGVLVQIKIHLAKGYPELERAIIQQTDEEELLLSDLVWTAADDETAYFGPEFLFEQCRTP
jgi:hypothetical protein